MTDDLDHDGTTWPRTALSGAFDDLVTIKLHSCHCTWYFQPVRMRFRREPKGIGIPGLSTGWRSYYGLRFADRYDGFTVCLDREGTRRLSARLHPAGSDACSFCNEHPESPEGGSTDDRHPQVFALPVAR